MRYYINHVPVTPRYHFYCRNGYSAHSKSIQSAPTATKLYLKAYSTQAGVCLRGKNRIHALYKIVIARYTIKKDIIVISDLDNDLSGMREAYRHA
jgi:hypothetical protein